MSATALHGHASFWDAARARPDAVALVVDDVHVTFAALERDVNRTSNGLRALGVREGNVVSACLPNGIDFIVIALATSQIGVHFVPVNPSLTAAEVQYIVQDSGASVVIVEDGDSAAALSASGNVPVDRFVVRGSAPLGWRDLADLSSTHSGALPSQRTAGELMGYTSGTTGRPKGVRKPLTGLAPEEALVPLLTLSRGFGYDGEVGAHLLCSPAYHAAPFSFALASLHIGHSLVVHRRFDPISVLRDIERLSITETHMVPTHFHRLMQLDESTRLGFVVSSLRSVVHAGAICPVPLKRAMIDWLGPILWEYLGATEGGVTSVSSADWLLYPGTVGRPFPGVEVRILDEAGLPTPVGEAGTIYFSTPGQSFEYHNDPEKTSSSRRGELSTVGDVGCFNEQGYLFVLDRRVDLIVSGGVNIYPAEIEGHLLSHPAVADAVVFGVPNDEWGAVPVAIVSARPEWSGGDDELIAELLAFCGEGLANYKKPKRIDVGVVPRTAAGKLERKRAREEFSIHEGVG